MTFMNYIFHFENSSAMKTKHMIWLFDKQNSKEEDETMVVLAESALNDEIYYSERIIISIHSIDK